MPPGDDADLGARNDAADHAADRRLAVALAFCLVTESAWAWLADASVIAVWLWLVLAVGSIGAAAGLAALIS